MDYVCFVRSTVRNDEKRQVKILTEAGYSAQRIVYEDAERAVKMMRPDRLLVVTTLDRLSANKRELKMFMTRIMEKGGVVFEVETKRRSDNGIELVEMFADALTRKGHDTETAREYGSRGGGWNKHDDKKRKRAKKLWANHDLTVNEIAEKSGVNPSTLFRWFGRRDLPSGKRDKS